MNNSIFNAARDAWLAADNFRQRRDRYKRYTYGDQWSDIVPDENGIPVPEREFVAQSGRKPLTNNMIRQIVKTVIGRYRNNCDENGVYRSDSPDASYIELNSLPELDCRMLEEFLISGCAIQRVDRGSRIYGDGLWIDNVDPRMFFVNPFKDPRGRDIRLIGMLHDISFPEIIARFSPADPARAAALSRSFAADPTRFSLADSAALGSASGGDDDFFTPPEGLCRLIEVWTLDCRNTLICHDRDNATAFKLSNSGDNRSKLRSINARRAADCMQPLDSRPAIDFIWRCRWFAPDGTLLAAYDSPYRHRSHPFAVKFYPLTDGEIHSFVEDVIDQQRYINRLIVLIDHMMGTSAKGVLLFPQDQKPKHVEWKEIAKTWAKSNGVIPITGLGTSMPQQVITATSGFGAYDLLSLQMKLFDNISGVGDIIAGRNISPSTGKELYESQLRNSTIALADLLDSFAAFRKIRDQKAQTT